MFSFFQISSAIHAPSSQTPVANRALRDGVSVSVPPTNVVGIGETDIVMSWMEDTQGELVVEWKKVGVTLTKPVK